MRNLQEHHEMKLEKVLASGLEEWLCPTCGRRIIVPFPPNYEKLTLERGEKYILAWGSSIGTAVCTKSVLEKGDESAFHHGNKTVTNIQALEAQWSNENSEEEEITLSPIGRLPVREDLTNEEAEDIRLSEDWRGWLGEMGFEDWWKRDLKSPE